MALDYETPQSNRSSGGTKLKLVIAWLIVTVPAAWGVGQTVNKSLSLFQSPPPAAAAPATAPAAATPTTAQ